MTSHEPKVDIEPGVRRAINLHAWPGRGKPKPPTKTRPRAERLSAHPGLILVAAAERYTTPERWGLGVALRFVGRSVTGAFLVVDDEAIAGDPALRRWARRQRVRTPEGDRRVEVITRHQLCHPDVGVLTTTCYGTGWLLTADEGRTLGLLAEHRAAARRKGFAGGFTLGLPGWGAWSDERSCWRAKLHRPTICAKVLGSHGVRAEFAAAGRGGHAPDGSQAGKWERDRRGRWLPFRGRIVDLMGPAFTLDGIDTAELGEHLVAFGLPGHSLPAAVTVDPAGAAELLAVARAVHGLAVSLDVEDARWFTTSDDRRQGRAAVGLRHALYSPGSLAAEALRRSGVTPPLVKFARPDDEALDRWAGAGHGGWTTAEIRGAIVPVCDIDVRSAHPAGFCLTGCWGVLCAEELHEVDATAELRALCEQVASGDVSTLFDPATYRAFGLTLAEVRCAGEPWPVEVPRVERPAESRFYVAPVRSPVPLPFAWPDVVGSAALSGRVPDIVSATRLVPAGSEAVRPLALYDGLVVPPGEDPVAAGVRLRARLDEAGDFRMAGQLRVLLNALSAGVFGRADVARAQGRTVEHLGPWSWPPIATTVSSVPRLWLALVEFMVRGAGSRVVTRDTDGVTFIAGPWGGPVTLPDGGVCQRVTWEGVEKLLRPFAQLNPFGDGGQFWKLAHGTKRQPLHMLALGRKRYAHVRSEGGGEWHVVGGTEHSLGGGVFGPPAMAGRDPRTRRHLWTHPVAEHALALALTPEGVSKPAFEAPWDGHGVDPFPVLRRFSGASPAALRTLPGALGVHPFAPLVEAQPDPFLSRHALSPLALDPGTDLAEWRELSWFDPLGPVRVTTTAVPNDPRIVALRTLRDFAADWAQPMAHDDPAEVVVDPRLIRRVGRSGALVDARLADGGASASDYRVLYDEGDPGAFVAEAARRIGPRPFERRTGVSRSAAQRAAVNGTTSPRNRARAVRALQMPAGVDTCALDGCEEPVPRPNARYCCRAHSDAAYRQRKREGGAAVVEGLTCAKCDALMFGGAVGRHGLCTDCEEGGDAS